MDITTLENWLWEAEGTLSAETLATTKATLTELGGFAFAMLCEDDRDRLSLRRRRRVAAHGEVRSVALG